MAWNIQPQNFTITVYLAWYDCQHSCNRSKISWTFGYFIMVWETGVQFQVMSYQRLKKWYLMLPCLALWTIRWGSKVKWSNPGDGVAPSSTPRCSSYWEGSLQVTLDYFFIVINGTFNFYATNVSGYFHSQFKFIKFLNCASSVQLSNHTWSKAMHQLLQVPSMMTWSALVMWYTQTRM